jgi:hypothetical protein
VNVVATPDDVVAGDTITATWAGLPAPAAGDRLQLPPLGSPVGDFSGGSGLRPTNGAAAGTQPIVLPASLKRGTSELRLLSTDPRREELAIMARSAPIRVAQAPPPPPPSSVCAGSCDDGLRASLRKLAGAMGVVTRLRRKGRLSAPCADSLRSTCDTRATARRGCSASATAARRPPPVGEGRYAA